jgi:hypothetical protein
MLGHSTLYEQRNAKQGEHSIERRRDPMEGTAHRMSPNPAKARTTETRATNFASRFIIWSDLPFRPRTIGATPAITG